MEIEGARIEFLGHDGFLIESKGKKIAIDPYNLSEKAGNEKADIILITHSHYDHCSIKDIAKLSKEGTTIVVPADAQSKITRVEKVNMQIIEVGDELEIGGIKIRGLPAYNINKEFHPKNEGWLGYLVILDKLIIYHAGDSDNIPEMKNLTGYGKHGNYFIMLLPVSGTTVMDVDEAVEVSSMINPHLVVPMHYGSGVVGTIDDATRFVEKCKNLGINAQILERF